jgi:ethylmalonyl-CoA mutase
VSSNATRAEIARLEKVLGRRPKLLVGELGVEGHSAVAEQFALKARDAGFDVVYESSRATAEQVVASAVEEGVHAIGLAEGGPEGAAPLQQVAARAAALGFAVPIVSAKGAGELGALIGELVRLVARAPGG